METMKLVKDTITISMEEYKELLMIKGKYEELRSLYYSYPKSTITYRDFNNEKELTPPYKVTCQDGSFHGHATQFGLAKKVD